MSAARPVTPPVRPTAPKSEPVSAREPAPESAAALPEDHAEDTAVLELTYSDVQRLSQLLGYNIQSPADILQRVARLSTVSVNGTEIVLPEGLLQRMKSRALRAWGEEWLKRTVLRVLSNEVGY